MKDLRRRFNRFCFKNRDKGLPNLMMYISIGCGILNLMSLIDPSNALFRLFYFDRSLILQGQLWRLITYPLCYSSGNLLLTAITLLCYYSIGRAIENIWGTFRFNLFYLTGVVMMDVYCMVFGGSASAYYLNMSLFLSYATLYPDSQFLLFFIIPVKAWIFALLDLIIVAMGLFGNPFPYNLFPVIALANYFLFFGKDVANVIPLSWRINAKRSARKVTTRGKTIPFHSAGSYQATHARPQAPYTHKCTVCSRTDVSDPQLEFRYCSRCTGYYCYCQDHINNHAHIQ